MSRFSRLVPLFAVSALIAACSPGDSDTPLSPHAPRYDGGLLVGTNAVPNDSTSPPPTTTSTTSTSSGSTLGDGDPPADSTGRSGLLVGTN